MKYRKQNMDGMMITVEKHREMENNYLFKKSSAVALRIKSYMEQVKNLRTACF